MNKKQYNIKYFFILLIIIVISSCSNYQTQEVIGFTQGSYYTIKYIGKEIPNLKHEIDSILLQFDSIASIFNPNSIINQVNDNKEVDSLPIDFVNMVNISHSVSEATDGYFDITVAPLVNAWGFGASKQPEEEVLQNIDSLLSFIGWRKIAIKNGKIYKKDNRIQLNFNAIAQGYIVDLIANFLREKGLKNYIVDLGGEVYAAGKKGNKNWIVGIESPADSALAVQNVAVKLALQDMSLVTSGNYRKYIEKNGKRYSHTINPKTGQPSMDKLLSVTVLHKQSAMADAYATAMMSMGYEQTLKYLQHHSDLNVYLIFFENGQHQTYITQGMQSLIQKGE